MQEIDLLKQLGFVGNQAEKLLNIARKEQLVLGKNDFFQQPGQTSKCFGLLTEGMLRYFYLTDEGEEITRWVSLPNEFVASLSSFIAQEPAHEFIQAIKPSRILIFPREQWLELYQQEAFARQFWVSTLEKNYIGMETRVFNLISKNAKQRYEWVCQHQPRFITEVPDKYLAAMLGIRPRHLSRLRGAK